MNDLHLQLRRVYQGWPSIPQARRTGIARTIADEIIISADLADAMADAGISGCELRPVRGCGAKAKVTPLWRQLWVTGKAGRTVAPTQFGVEDAEALIPGWREAYEADLRSYTPPRTMPGNPYWDPKSAAKEIAEERARAAMGWRCPRGHVSGDNLLSEVYVERAKWDGSDICATEDMVGWRQGVLVPSPIILISQRFYRLLQEGNFKGFRVEVAHLV